MTDPIQVFSLMNSQIIPQSVSMEVSTSLQIPTFQIIGLPGPEVSEAKDRIKSAIENSGLPFPKRKVILNLSPAHIKKQGTGLDLPMALAVLLDEKTLKRPFKVFAWGELGLDGSIKSVGQTTRALSIAFRNEADLIVLPRSDRGEIKKSLTYFPNSPRSRILIADHLKDAYEAILDPRRISNFDGTPGTVDSPQPPGPSPSLLPLHPELSKVIALTCASSHHLLLLGPKGSGKSHALEWLSALMPEADPETRRMQIYLSEMRNRRENPSSIRRVGAQVKSSSLLGSFHGGSLSPGEFSLAHGGVLLADEFPEWSRDSREALREPLERGWITLTRVQGSIELPACFIFAANGNLCPCGGVYSEHIEKHQSPCRCLPHHRQKYLARLSGPVLDRIDWVYTMRPGRDRKPSAEAPSLPDLRLRVQKLRDEQIKRFQTPIGLLSGIQLEDILTLEPKLQVLLEDCESKSLRDRHKTFRLALSLALWDEKIWPEKIHFVEARLLRGTSLHDSNL